MRENTESTDRSYDADGTIVLVPIVGNDAINMPIVFPAEQTTKNRAIIAETVHDAIVEEVGIPGYRRYVPRESLLC